MRNKADAVTRPHGEGRNIPGERRRAERLVGLLVAGVILLNFPFLSVFNVNRLVFGIPVLYLYLFSVWILIIGVKAVVLRQRLGEPSTDKPGDNE